MFLSENISGIIFLYNNNFIYLSFKMYDMLETGKIGEITGKIMIWADQDPDYPNHGSEKHQWGHIGMPVEILEETDFHYFVMDFNKTYEPIYALKSLIDIIDIEWKQLEVNTCK